MNTPQELKGYGWLRLLGSTRFIIVLYDGQGRPIWAQNQASHNYAHLIQVYLQDKIFHYFDMPGITDLNDTFRKEPFRELANAPNHLDLVAQKELELGAVPSFNSKNLVEPAALCPYFAINQPLTIAALLRVNSDRFVAVIMIRPLGYLVSLSEKRNVLIADGRDRIIGYSSLFAGPLRLADPNGLLGRPVPEVLVFNRPPLLPPEAAPLPDLKPVADWRAGQGEFPFDPFNVRPGDLVLDGDRMIWGNTNDQGLDYAYLRLKVPFPVDEAHARVEIGFETSGAKIPNLILRGTDWIPLNTPDSLGYALTNTGNERRCRFKKNAQNVKFLSLPDLGPGKSHLLGVVRSRDRFHFHLDGKPFDAWHDTSAFLTRTQDALYLFLRPGERMVLTSFRAAFRPFTPADRPPQEPLTADYLADSGGVHYNATVEETVIGNENCVFYQFEDVTAYLDDIKNLRTERDTLSGLLQSKSLFVGQAPAIAEIRNTLKRVADRPIAVLIEGETGTGKEVLARLIHDESRRRDMPFVKIDCSTLPASLIESELFGHEKGSFTGAHASHPGRFEQAKGGTVFLDEVANLPREVQAKLLGVLQDNEVYRIGASKPVKLDFRLIAASNIPLKRLVEEERFRSDLYYRLNQFRFSLPALRERPEDIPLLARHFLDEANLLYEKSIGGFTREALEVLYRHSWPGNVRELRNGVMRAVVLAAGPLITESDIHPESPESAAFGVPRAPARKRRRRLQEKAVREALEKSGGHVSEAARALEISRAMIYVLMKKFAIEPADFRQPAAS